MKIVLRDTGIMHETTAPYHHESNGMAEKLIQSLNDSARAMLLQASMSQQF